MEGSLWEFRSLVLDIRDGADPEWGEGVLLPWLEQHPRAVEELRELGRPGAHLWQFGPGDDVLWGLYAVGRLVDILLGPHQPVNDDPALLNWTTGKPWWSGPGAAPLAWSTFCAGAGAITIAEDEFHPFFHEIVEVESADNPDEPVTLVGELWPGALIGGLLLARAGVTVRAGANVLKADVASRSCLYWAWWRRNRLARDLSHGWGHNSQWRTEFRRDYVVGDVLHYNVDHTLPADSPADRELDLTTAERHDLLRFRHSLRRDLGTDRWPYYDSLVEPRHKVYDLRPEV